MRAGQAMFQEIDIVLASASPRRAALLEMLGVRFEVIVSHADEAAPTGLSPADAALWAACQKADAVLKQLGADFFTANPLRTVLACDTVVVICGQILGKPKDRDEGLYMLKLLSGKVHTVISGVCIQGACGRRNFYESTQVEFHDLDDELCQRYLDTGKYSDKAGGYGIQGKGAVLVKSIHGDYFNIVGLPLARTMREIETLHAPASFLSCNIDRNHS